MAAGKLGSELATLAAFYYHPDMDVARARWHAATAGKITAGHRPNPNLSFTPRVNSTSIGTGVTPWILGGVLDIPIETMGKRKYRVAQAKHLDEMARLELAQTAWLVRSRVRSSLVALQAAQGMIALVRDQADALGRVDEVGRNPVASRGGVARGGIDSPGRVPECPTQPERCTTAGSRGARPVG